MQESFFSERGLYYRVSEIRPNLPTIVLLHGLSGSSSVWLPYEERLENTHNILSLDLRGHGKSKRWSTYREYNFQFFAEDILLLLRQLNIETYILVSHSFGTLVALHVLLQKNGAEKLLLLSPNYAVHRTFRARLTRGILGLVTTLFSWLPSVYWRGEHIDYSKLGYSKDWDRRRLYLDIFNTGVRTYLHCLHHIYAFKRDSDWSRISIPTLVVHGAQDSFVPIAHALELVSIIPHAKFKMLGNANHVLVLNNFEDVATIIENFTSQTVT